MKKILSILIIINISCAGNGQNKIYNSPNYEQKYVLIENRNPEYETNNYNRVYNTYFVADQDTVLLIREEYKQRNKDANDTINEVSQIEKYFNISKNTGLYLSEDNYIFLISNEDKKYSLLDEITDEYETFYDENGAHEMFFPTRDIEQYKENEYIVLYYNEGIFKIGIYAMTEQGVTKKFLTKGCLIYDEWSEFEFFKVKDEKVFVYYLKEWDSDEIGQVELKYENGEYSLDLNQCN